MFKGGAKTSYIERKKFPGEIKHNTEGINKVQVSYAFSNTKAAKLIKVCTNFQVLNEKLLKINQTFLFK